MKRRTCQFWADRLHVGPSAVHKWTTGLTRISLRSAKRLEQETGLKWHEIMELSPEGMARFLGITRPANRAIAQPKEQTSEQTSE